MFKSVEKSLANTAPWFARFFQRMAQMAGQHEKTFNQAGHQNTEQHQRNGANKLAHHTSDEQHGNKRRQSGQRRRRYRQHHAQRPAFSGGLRIGPLLGQGCRMFAHHNRIIDNNPNRHNQGEERQHVNRHTEI